MTGHKKASSSSKNNIFNTINNIRKVLGSKGFSRTVGLGILVASAAGLIPVAYPVFIASAVGIGVAVAIDTYAVYQTKKLYTEAKLLRDNKLAVNKQKEILDSNPEIRKALEKKLFVASKTGKSKIRQEHKTSRAHFLPRMLSTTAAYLLDIAGSITSTILSKNPVDIITLAASSVVGMTSGGMGSYSMSKVRNSMRKFIADERTEDYSPGYNDQKSLKEQVRKQRIQAMALQELAKETKNSSLEPALIEKKFDIIVAKIKARETKIKKANNVFVKYGKKIARNFIRTHNPFSIYHDPARLHQEFAIKKEQRKDYLEEISPKIRKIFERNKNVKPQNNAGVAAKTKKIPARTK